MMLRVSPVLLPVIAVELFYRIGAFLQDLFQKDFGGVLCLVRKNCRIQIPGEVVDGNKQVFSSPESRFSLEQWQPLRISVEHLPGIILVVVPGSAL